MPKLLIVTTIEATLRAFLLPYAEHFRKLGWTVDAMARGVTGCEVCGRNFDNLIEVPFTRNPLDFRTLRGVGDEIRAAAEEGKYDVIHVHTPVAAFVTRFALRKLRHRGSDGAAACPKIVYTAHGFHFYDGGNPFKNAAFAALERLAGDWTDHTVTINREDYEAALDYKIAPKERLSLLPGVGLDFARYSRAAVSEADVKNFRSALALGKDDELFLMAAEFNPGKRHRDALDALAKTGRKNFHMAFAGSGPLEDEMKRKALSMGLAARAHFLGGRVDVPVLMRASRATVLPSEREGLNRSVMESICLGVPVLGADARGIRDLVTGPERGALFPVGNSAALAAAMILAVDEPSLAEPKPDPLWNIEHLLNEHEKLYKGHSPLTR